MTIPHSNPDTPAGASAVLLSGGLDSVVLLAHEIREAGPSARVQPIHVRAGLAWEDAEARTIARLLSTPPFAGRIAPLATVTVDMRDVYPSTHWAVSGTPPAYDTPDEDVYLDGRNIVLISKASVLCARLGIHRIALGLLMDNPFPDATPAFFSAMASAMSSGLNHAIEIATPFTQFHKDAVVKLGQKLDVPMAATLSCMSPATGDRHCGQCSKCRERHDAFIAAEMPDPTDYQALRA